MRIAAPMWILRDRAREDFEKTVRSLEGFSGVEFLDFFGRSAKQVKQICNDAGLTAMGSHVPYETLADDTERVLDYHEEIGCFDIVAAGLTAEKALRFMEETGTRAMERGFRIHFHNHAEELTRMSDGVRELDAILQAKELLFECDAGWIEIAGANAAEYMTRYGDRIRIFHMKDYFAADKRLTREMTGLGDARGGQDKGYFEFRPTGFGVMNYPELMPLIREIDPEWIVADHDASYERDPVRDLTVSRLYIEELLKEACRP